MAADVLKCRDVGVAWMRYKFNLTGKQDKVLIILRKNTKTGKEIQMTNIYGGISILSNRKGI